MTPMMSLKQRLLLLALVPVFIALGILVPTLAGSAPATAPQSGSAFPPCNVTLAVNSAGTQATATIVSGCVGPGFAFRSFIHPHTDNLFDSVTSAPWVVNLPSVPPTCDWQIDFSFTSPPVAADAPVHHIYASLIGGGPCPPPPTTTTTTTTTVPPPTTTTTTTAPPTTTTTLPGCKSCQIPTPGPVTIPPGTPPAPVAPITQEQQQIQVAPGVTAGNG